MTVIAASSLIETVSLISSGEEGEEKTKERGEEGVKVSGDERTREEGGRGGHLDGY